MQDDLNYLRVSSNLFHGQKILKTISTLEKLNRHGCLVYIPSTTLGWERGAVDVINPTACEADILLEEKDHQINEVGGKLWNRTKVV